MWLQYIQMFICLYIIINNISFLIMLFGEVLHRVNDALKHYRHSRDASKNHRTYQL